MTGDKTGIYVWIRAVPKFRAIFPGEALAGFADTIAYAKLDRIFIKDTFAADSHILYNAIARHHRAIGVKLRKEAVMETVKADSNRTVPSVTTQTYRVADIAKILDIGRSSAYSLVKAGLFKTVHVGTSIRISKHSFDAWLENQS